ncbi:helix-turn-helix domain-containing protein [Nocardia sp. NPDC057227]|uniref:helix-turn-helix domain-containing protein n=1 Tax=Nocardia sp. NPDC057227 TaxID=3346056 RepID=UPI00363B6000
MVEVEWNADAVVALRAAMRRSRAEFARTVGVSKRTLALWESGTTTSMHAASRRLLDKVLAEADDGIVSRFHWSLRQRTSLATPKTPAPNVDLVADSANRSAALLNWAEASNTGPLTIAGMCDELRSVSRSYLKEPTRPLFDRSTVVRDRAAELLSGRQHPSHAALLYGVAGWALTLLGWITIDLGKPDIADKHLRAAWAFAENADDDNLRAWVRASQHTSSFWREDYLAAAEYARDGLQYATDGTAALFLYSALALDLAHARDGRGAASARDRAIDLGAASAESPGPDVLAGPFSCSIERAGGLWADTSLTQVDPARSLEFATAAVQGYASIPDDRRNVGSERMVRCQEIKAHVALGNFDVAQAQLEHVAEATPDEHRIGPLAQRVEEIAWMARDVAAAGARGVVDCAVEFRRAPRAGTLPMLSGGMG